jgi:predicted P-loop ATPase
MGNTPLTNQSSNDNSAQTKTKGKKVVPIRRTSGGDDWQNRLLLTEKGSPRANLANAMLALESVEGCKGLIAYNDLAESISVLGPLPSHAGLTDESYPRTWKDQDDILVAAWLQREHEIDVGDGLIAKAAAGVAYHHHFHPVRDYLCGLTWDGTERLPTWLTVHLGVADSKYARAVGTMWMISAVARVMQPGCKADCALILEGQQGLKKSTAVGILGGAWFTDQLADMGTKDADEQLRGSWLVELGELSSMSKTEVERVKAFLARKVDRFRVSYGRHVGEYPRQCVFAGTTNATTYLKDETGDRRFWPVFCTKVVDTKALAEVRDQLWAEARVRFDRGEQWWLEAIDLLALAKTEQEARFQADVWEKPIGEYLFNRGSTTLADVLADALKLEVGKWGQNDQRRVAQCLNRLGWEKKRRRTGEDGALEYRYYPKKAEDGAPPVPAGLASAEEHTGIEETASDPPAPTVPSDDLIHKTEGYIFPKASSEPARIGGDVGSDPTSPDEDPGSLIHPASPVSPGRVSL